MTYSFRDTILRIPFIFELNFFFKVLCKYLGFVYIYVKSIYSNQKVYKFLIKSFSIKSRTMNNYNINNSSQIVIHFNELA